MKAIRRILFAAIVVLCASGAAAQDYFLHTVTKGQGLYSISRMYGVTQEAIIELNPGSERIIRVGQQLRIPQNGNAAQATYNADNGTFTPAATQQQGQPQRFHTISKGETLYRLTVMYGVSASEICAANPGLSAENFRIGQVIVIPERTPQTAPQPTEEVRSVSLDALVSAAEAMTSCKSEHKVKRLETIYSITRQYGISEEELVRANPFLRNGKLKRGQVLCIPYSAQEQAAMVRADVAEGTTDTKPADGTPADSGEPIDDEQLFEDAKPSAIPYPHLTAAVILPFMLDDSTSADGAKMVEYYEGFLLAVDSMKHQGMSIELHVFDSGNERKSIQPILDREEMQDVNIIFGPLYAKHIAEATAFAQEHAVPIVVPFARNIDEVYSNPQVFQVNTPQSYLYSDVTDHFFACFPNPNVLFFRNPNEKDDPFYSAFKEELIGRGASYQELRTDTTSDVSKLMAFCRPECDNVLMLTSSGKQAVSGIMPVFQLMARSAAASGYQLHLFGYPEYQIYTSARTDAYYETGTWFYTSFYTNNLLPDAKSFHNLFRHTYSRDIVNRYPKYAILGFDTGYYFLKALDRFGSSMPDHIAEVSSQGIQTGFRFERVNNWGGFINRKSCFIHLSPDYELKRIDFDK